MTDPQGVCGHTPEQQVLLAKMHEIVSRGGTEPALKAPAAAIMRLHDAVLKAKAALGAGLDAGALDRKDEDAFGRIIGKLRARAQAIAEEARP